MKYNILVRCSLLIWINCLLSCIQQDSRHISNPAKEDFWFKKSLASVDSLIEIEKYEDAITLSNLISDSAETTQRWKFWANSRIRIAKSKRIMNPDNGYNTAFQLLLSDIDKASNVCPENIGLLSFHTAFTCRKLKNYGMAKKYYEIARQYHETKSPVTTEAGVYLYKTLGNIYTRLGDNTKAINILQKGLDSCLFQNLTDEIPNLYSDLGLAFLNDGQDQKAYAVWINGLDYNAQHPHSNLQEDSILKSILYRNLAEINLHRNAFPVADSLLKLSINLDPYNYEAFSLRSRFYQSKNKLNFAYKDCNHALKILGGQLYEYDRERGKLLVQLSGISFQSNQIPQALQDCNHALQTVLPNFQPEGHFSNPDPAQFYPENTILEALNLKSEIAWTQYNREHDTKWLELAAQSTALALQMNDTLIAAFGYTSSKLLSLEQTRDLYERNLAILFERKNQGLPGASEAIFAFAERSKSMLLRQHLAESKAIRQLPKALAERDNALRNQINSLREEYTLALADEAGETQLKSINRAIFDAETRHQHFLDSLKQRYPAFYRATQAPAQTSLAAVQKWLPADALLLSWFYNPESGALFLVGVDKNTITTRQENLDSRRLEAFLALISNPQLNLDLEGDTAFIRSYANEAAYLYDKLVRPVAGNTPPRELIVVPDGMLGSLPLDALLPAPPEKLSFRHLPYLLHQTRCRFAPSASLLMDTPRHQGSFSIGYLGIAPSYQGDSTFASIAYNSACVERLSASLKGQQFIGSNASKARSLKSAEQCQVLHFYGHGQANSENPQASFLAFSSNSGINSAKSDSAIHLLRPGLLAYNKPLPVAEAPRVWFAEEIGQRPLQAQLVLLSACETGLGKAAGAEGILSLSRAFQDAGVPSAVMTLWSVDDQATAQLSEGLLLKLQSGNMSKDEALRQAKMQYLQSGSAAAPFFWAGMVLTGDSSPLKIQESPQRIEIAGNTCTLLTIALLVGLLALIILLFYKILRY